MEYSEGFLPTSDVAGRRDGRTLAVPGFGAVTAWTFNTPLV